MTTSTTYTPIELDPSVVYDMGVNAPVYHQRAIAYLTTGLMLDYRAGKFSYEPLPEMMVGEYSSPTPDIILYDSNTESAKVIIEICQTKGEKADLQKVIQLIDSAVYDILEGFVYNYKTQQWLRYGLGDGGVANNSSVSSVLQVDLNTYLQPFV